MERMSLPVANAILAKMFPSPLGEEVMESLRSRKEESNLRQLVSIPVRGRGYGKLNIIGGGGYSNVSIPVRGRGYGKSSLREP